MKYKCRFSCNYRRRLYLSREISFLSLVSLDFIGIRGVRERMRICTHIRDKTTNISRTYNSVQPWFFSIVNREMKSSGMISSYVCQCSSNVRHCHLSAHLETVFNFHIRQENDVFDDDLARKGRCLFDRFVHMVSFFFLRREIDQSINDEPEIVKSITEVKPRVSNMIITITITLVCFLKNEYLWSNQGLSSLREWPDDPSSLSLAELGQCALEKTPSKTVA